MVHEILGVTYDNFGPMDKSIAPAESVMLCTTDVSGFAGEIGLEENLDFRILVNDSKARLITSCGTYNGLRKL
jgi:hypothetical protein